jgi:hypothetical protein
MSPEVRVFVRCKNSTGVKGVVVIVSILDSKRLLSGRSRLMDSLSRLTR